MKYKAILWDADGVVIKSPYLFSEQLALDYGISMDKMLPFFTGVFRECSLGKADLREELAKVIGDWGWQGTVDELIDYWFTKGTVFDPEVSDFIKLLKAQGVRCFMTTDNEKYRGQYLRSQLSDLFEQVFLSGEIGLAKKDRGFFEYVWERIGVDDKAEVLFVDDSARNVEVAKEFGIAGYFFSDLNDLKKYLAE